MGITMQALENLHSMGFLPPKSKVLDIGSSNLYSATEDALRRFIAAYGDDVSQTGLDQFIKRIAKGSAFTSAGGINESFVGELLELVGIEYLALDIAIGYRTKVFDLNFRALAPELCGRFDTVLNFGTTEHLLNQINAFSVIHDATKPGGVMVHNLPSDGFIDHGYVRYTPQFFFDIAQHNGYEITFFEFEGPLPGKNIYDALGPHVHSFEALDRAVANAPSHLKSYSSTDVGIMIILRKTGSARFSAPMEVRTSVGAIGVGEAGFSPSVSELMETRQLYSIAGTALRIAARRTAGAVGRVLKRKLRRTPN